MKFEYKIYLNRMKVGILKACIQIETITLRVLESKLYVEEYKFHELRWENHRQLKKDIRDYARKSGVNLTEK